TRRADSELAAGRSVSQQRVRNRISSFNSQVPRLHNCPYLLGGPTDIEWASALENQNHRLLRRDDHVDEVTLIAGQIDGGTRACLATHSGQFTNEQDDNIGFLRGINGIVNTGGLYIRFSRL